MRVSDVSAPRRRVATTEVGYVVWAVAQLDRRPTSTQGARRWLMPRGTRGCAWRVSRTPGCSPATAPTSTTSASPGCCTPPSCAVPSPGPRSAASTPPRRSRHPACARCSPPPTSTPTSRSSGTRRSGRAVPRRPARRSPRARCASPAIRSRWWSPRRRYLAEDAAELVDVDYEPLPAVVDYLTAAATPTDLVHEHHGSNVIGELAGLPAAALDELFESAPHVVSETISQQAYVAVPMEGRGLVVDHSTGTGELTIYAATQSPHEVRLFCSRLLGLPEHRIRVVMRDTGGGFGQKIMVQRDEMCLMLAAPKSSARR